MLGPGSEAEASGALPWRLRTEWVVIRGRRGERVPVEARRWVTERQGPRGPTGRRLVWADGHDDVVVAAWEVDPIGVGVPWHADDTGVVVARGQFRRIGEPWRPPGTWACDVARRRRATRDHRAHPFDGLVGDGSIVAVSADGWGALAADPMGLGEVHRSSGDGFEVFASDPVLAAEASGVGRRPVSPDPMATAWLCHTGFLVGGQTAVEGVTKVRVGAMVALEPGRGASVGAGDPWLDAGPLEDAGEEEILDHIASAVIDQVQAAFTLGSPPVLDLTGGKDSRLLLALALAAGVGDRLTTRTVGTAQLPDVTLARRLAAQVGVSHRVDSPFHPRREPYADRARRFVQAVGGSRTLWAMSLREGRPGEVRLSGTMGEELRCGRIESAWHQRFGGRLPERPDDVVRQLVARYRAGTSGLLRPDVIDALNDAVERELLDGPVEQPAKLMGNYLVRHRGARYGGPLLDQDDDHRVFALFSLETIRGTYRLDPMARRLELIHHHLIDRCSEALASYELDGPGWVGDFVDQVIPLPEVPSESDVPAGVAASPGRHAGAAPAPAAAPVAAPAKSPDLIVSMTSKPNEARQAFLEAALDDPGNRLWEVVDRDAALAKVRSLDDLALKDRTKLYALATGAVWLQG